jgi:hypothetical protein
MDSNTYDGASVSDYLNSLAAAAEDAESSAAAAKFLAVRAALLKALSDADALLA